MPAELARPRFARAAASILFTAFLVLFAAFRADAQTPGVGATAPDFSLNTPQGHAVRLRDFHGEHATVLVVLRGYPGYQCPLCQKQVHDFVEHSKEFAARGASVLLVYPGPPAELDAHAKEFLASQPALPANVALVTDPEYRVTNLYGLRWEAPHETAYPSTFILDSGDKVLFEKISRSHGDRTVAADVLAMLK